MKFHVPPGGVKPHALHLVHDKNARRVLRSVRIVVAVYPNGDQEVLFGGDDLAHQLSLAGADSRSVEGVLLIRCDRSEHADLIAQHLVREKNLTQEKIDLMRSGTPRGLLGPEGGAK